VPKQRRRWSLRGRIGRTAARPLEEGTPFVIKEFLSDDPEAFASIKDLELKADLIQYKAITLVNSYPGLTHAIGEDKPKKSRIITLTSAGTGIDAATMRPVETVSEASHSFVRLVGDEPGPGNSSTEEIVCLTSGYDRDGGAPFNLPLTSENLLRYDHEQLNGLYQVLSAIELAALEEHGQFTPLSEVSPSVTIG
jgi:hypothetical protein